VPIPRTLAWDAGKLKHVDKHVLCTRAGNAQQKRRLNLAMNRLALRRRVLFYSRLLHFHSKRPTRREPVRCNPFDAISPAGSLRGPHRTGIASAPAPPLTCRHPKRARTSPYCFRHTPFPLPRPYPFPPIPHHLDVPTQPGRSSSQTRAHGCLHVENTPTSSGVARRSTRPLALDP